jgi:hypothetical protein
MIIISSKVEYFEYYHLLPLLKEISNYRGYTLKLKYLKNLTQQVLINISQSTKWVFFFHEYYNKIYFNNFFFFKDLKKKNQKYKIYFQLEEKIYIKENITIEKDITNQAYLLDEKNFYLCKQERSYGDEYDRYVYDNKTKELPEISLFFSKYFQKRLKNKIRLKKKPTIYFFNKIKQLPEKSFFYFFFKLILSYKKWKADKLYIKMAHIAYCENLIDFSITLFKMARFEKQTFFFISILKI